MKGRTAYQPFEVLRARDSELSQLQDLEWSEGQLEVRATKVLVTIRQPSLS